MDPILYQAAAHTPPAQLQSLYQLATSPGAPTTLARRLHMGMGLVAALLVGSGLIFWIAANWQTQSRFFKLGLLEAALVLCIAAACCSPRVRVAGLLAANLALGGLLAFIGQTYQTGADAWQLFAAWAALSLLWTALARSDVLWLLWMLIAATALWMWQGALTPWWDWLDRTPSMLNLVCDMLLWLPVALLPWVVSLLPWLRLPQGLGLWSHRLGMALTLSCWTAAGLLALYSNAGMLPLAVAALGVAAAMYVSLRGPLANFAVLSVSAIAANALVMGSAIYWLTNTLRWSRNLEVILFLITAGGLLCLGTTVMGLNRAQRILHPTLAPSSEELA